MWYHVLICFIDLLYSTSFDYSVCFIRIVDCSIRVFQSLEKVTLPLAPPSLSCYAYDIIVMSTEEYLHVVELKGYNT